MFTEEQLKKFQDQEFATMFTGKQILQIVSAISQSPTQVGMPVLSLFTNFIVDFIAKRPKEEKKEEKKEETTK